MEPQLFMLTPLILVDSSYFIPSVQLKNYMGNKTKTRVHESTC